MEHKKMLEDKQREKEQEEEQRIERRTQEQQERMRKEFEEEMKIKKSKDDAVRFLYCQSSNLRDCKRNLKWPSMPRWQCPIYNLSDQ